MPPDPVVKPAPPPTPPTSIAAPGEFPPEGFTGTPNWKARFLSVATWLQPKFKPPQVGQRATLQLNAGGEAKGTIKQLDNASVTLQVPLAQGEIEATYTRGQLAPRTRSNLFTEDACRTRAADIVRREKAQWEEQERMLAAKSTPAPPRPSPNTSTPAPQVVQNVVPVNDRQRGGAVKEVITWMKSNLRNAESIRVVKWYPIQKDSKGYQVRCKYNIEMDGFGQAEERRIFFINHQGRVYRTAGYKEE